MGCDRAAQYLEVHLRDASDLRQRSEYPLLVIFFRDESSLGIREDQVIRTCAVGLAVPLQQSGQSGIGQEQRQVLRVSFLGCLTERSEFVSIDRLVDRECASLRVEAFPFERE